MKGDTDMKTNVKDCLFILGEIPVDTGRIKLGDALTGRGITYETRADGGYPVLAETDGNGVVTTLLVDVSQYNFLFNNTEVTKIDEEDIVEFYENF